MRSFNSSIGLTVLLAIIFTTLGAAPAWGQDLTYEPRNPSFGGRSVNGSYFLNLAREQNPFESEGGGQFEQDPLQNFEQRLQRQVLNQISQRLIEQRFGNIDLSEEGSFSFDRFTVDVTPGPGGVNIRVFNKQTGESTTVEIPRF